MPLLASNTNPTNRQLKQFGFTLLIVAVASTWWLTDSSVWLAIAGVVGTVLAGLGMLQPEWLKPLFVGMVYLTSPISFVVGELIMLTVYFGIFFPLAVLFRIISRDTLNRRQSQQPNSYWCPRSKQPSVESYFRQS